MPSGYVLTDYDYYGESSGMGTYTSTPTTKVGAIQSTYRPRRAIVAIQEKTIRTNKIGAVVSIYNPELAALIGMEL